MHMTAQQATEAPSKRRIGAETSETRALIVAATEQVIREVAASIGANGLFNAEGLTWKQEHKLMAAVLNRIDSRQQRFFVAD